MYRKDVLDGQGHHDAGETRPGSRSPTSRPRSTAREPGMAGICLRGQPGWGQVFAPLTTVVNTFGGTWFTKDWQAEVDAPRVPRGDELLRRPGPRARRERGAAGRVHRVPEQPHPGQRRHVVRRDLGGGLAGGGGLPGQGQDRLRRRAGGEDRRAPAGSTPGPGASSRPAPRRTTPGSSSPGRPARSTRNWSASKLGWSRVPAGKRASTYENPDYLKVASAFAEPTKQAIETADPSNPGVQPRPATGHPVHRHPGVPRPRHPGLAGRQLGDRRPDERRRGPGTRARSSPTTSPSATGPGSEVTAERSRPIATGGAMSTTPGRAPASTAAAAGAPAGRAAAPHRRLGPPGAAAARADLHDHGDPAAVRGDAGHLVHELERLLPRRARLRRASTTTVGCSPTRTCAHAIVVTIVLTVGRGARQPDARAAASRCCWTASSAAAASCGR